MTSPPLMAKKLTLDEIRQAWESEHVNNKDPKQRKDGPPSNRKWQLVRLYVSSTFKDFQSERQILLEKILPELKQFCESRNLTLIVCDLRHDVPMSSENEQILRASLEEIDRCYDDNGMPFFLNMTGNRVGWVPGKDSIPESIRKKYNWTDGFSVTEMEIMHGAYRHDNPNALIMLRNEIKKAPEEMTAIYTEDQLPSLIAERKLETLKKNLSEKFERNWQLSSYSCEFDAEKSAKLDEPHLKCLNEFEDKVKAFFIRRLSAWYPDDEVPDDFFDRINAQQEAFMFSKAEDFEKSGSCRIEKIREIISTLCGNASSLGPKPCVIVGPPGIGKTTLMAKLAKELINAKMGRVFYHFVGATVCSNDLLIILQRMLLNLGIIEQKQLLPENIATAITLFRQAIFEKKEYEPSTDGYFFLVIDGLDIIDEDEEALDWMPRQMTANTRWLFSFAESNQHRSYLGDISTFETLGDFTNDDKKIFVEQHLKRYNKEFQPNQMACFLDRASENTPLWSYLALEKLRLESSFENVNKKIAGLDSGLTGLFDTLLASLEEQSDQQWLATIVSLLAYSQYGLLESEILHIMSTVSSDRKKYPELRQFVSEIGNLLSNKKRELTPWSYNLWAKMYELLKPFIRPYGGSGEGVLYLHHQQLIEAAKDRYVKRWTHVEAFITETLFVYFQQSKRADRVEEMSKTLSRSGNNSKHAIELAEILVSLNQGSIDSANLYRAKCLYLNASNFDDQLNRIKLLKNNNALKPEQIVAIVKRCCELFKGAVEIFSTSPLVTKQDSRIWRCYERLYFRHNDLIERKLNVEENKTASLVFCKKAFEICEQLEEPARQIALADCWVTRGVCENKLRYLMRGLELAESGQLRATRLRALRCIGDHYETEDGNSEEAYNYYLRWYDLLVDTFGPIHPRTKPAFDLLNDEKFRRFAP